jgi:hypothetical protein
MANEALTIVIGARDQASAVLRGVTGAVRQEIGAINAAGATAGDGISSGFARATSFVKEHEMQLKATGAAVAGLGVAITGMAAAGLSAYRRQEQAQQKLAAAIKGTGQAIDQSKLEKLARDLQKTTTFGDEATIEMMALLTTFNLTEDQVMQLAPRIQNISAIMGTDLSGAAIAVGKAIQLGSATALRRYGIIIDDAAMASGNFADILKAIDKNTGPAAEALAKGAGAGEQFKNTLGDLMEIIGKALVPGLRLATSVLGPLVELMQHVADSPIGQALIAVTVAVGGLMVPLGGLLYMLPGLVRGWEMLTGAQLRNAAAARTAAAANTAAATAAGAGGAAAAAGGAATAAGGAAGIAGAAAAGAAGRGLLARAGGAIAGVAGRVALPIAAAVTAYSLLKGHYERQIAADEAKAAEFEQPAPGFAEWWAGKKGSACHQKPRPPVQLQLPRLTRPKGPQSRGNGSPPPRAQKSKGTGSSAPLLAPRCAPVKSPLGIR